MATTTGGEDRLLATAQRIITSLRTTKDVTDDMLLILSSFDNRFSNISKLIGGGTTTPAASTNAINVVAVEMSYLESTEKTILRHVRRSPNHHLFDINSSVNESCEFLTAIDNVLDLLTHSTIKDNIKVKHRLESLVESAMSKLEDELQLLLKRSAIIPLDLDHLNGNMHRVSLSFVSHDDDLIHGVEFGSFNNQSFHEKGGSIIGDVSLKLVNVDVISDLKGIAARMIRAGYEKEFSLLFSGGRGDVLEEYLENLGLERIGIEEVHKTEWSDLDEKMKRWARVMKIVVRVILVEENNLCDQIIDGSNFIREVCFIETTKRCIMQLLNFGEAVATAKRSPEKLFRILDMCEALSGTLPCLQVLFRGELGDFVCAEANGVLDRLGNAAKNTFLEFETSVKHESSRRPMIGGGIHPLARYVMNYVKLVVDYTNTLNFLLESNTKNKASEKYITEDAINDQDNNNSDNELGERSSLGRKLTSLIDSLEANLEEKAKYYENIGLRYIFLMNNKLYIIQKVKDSKLRELLGDDWVKRQRGIIRKCSTNYLRASWTKVLASLKDESGTGGGASSAISNIKNMAFKNMAIKERLKNFNLCFEELYKIQTGWKVPDPQLRTELRISISEKLIPAYRSFLGRFGSQLQSGRNVGKYVKYTTEDLDAYLADLFEGSPSTINHIRRK